MTPNPTEAAAAYWNQRATVPLLPRTRWWQSDTILRHINRLLTGSAIPGAHAGFHELLRQAAPQGRYRKAVSVGCGTGAKEAGLVQAGLVEQFHLYEISDERIRQGRSLVQAKGLGSQMRFYEADAFAACSDRDFDLVYWNNSLHHMADVERALIWSRDRLRHGGVLGMDDFVGPSRFQWSERSMRYAAEVRGALLPRHLKHPKDPQAALSRQVRRPSVERMIETDPSEAADSERILPTLRRVFPDAKVWLTGGVIYHLAFNDVLANIDEQEDGPLLRAALLLDQALAEQGEAHYAVALAQVR